MLKDVITKTRNCIDYIKTDTTQTAVERSVDKTLQGFFESIKCRVQVEKWSNDYLDYNLERRVKEELKDLQITKDFTAQAVRNNESIDELQKSIKNLTEEAKPLFDLIQSLELEVETLKANQQPQNNQEIDILRQTVQSLQLELETLKNAKIEAPVLDMEAVKELVRVEVEKSLNSIDLTPSPLQTHIGAVREVEETNFKTRTAEITYQKQNLAVVKKVNETNSQLESLKLLERNKNGKFSIIDMRLALKIKANEIISLVNDLESKNFIYFVDSINGTKYYKICR
jgi:hypothetical protein